MRISDRKLVIRISNENIVMFIYAILALEYDLYNFFGLGSIISGSLLTLIEIILLVMVIITTRYRVKSHYVVYGCLIMAIIGTYVLFPECREYLQLFFAEGSSLKKVFLLPIAAQSITNPERFVDKFYKFSVVEGYIHIICNAIWGYGYTEWGVFNYMTYGFALIPPTCLVMQKMFSKPSKINIMTFVIFELNILIYGHRGALLVTMVMFGIFFMRYVRSDRKVLIGVATVILFMLLYLLKNELIEAVISVMDNLNLESRTLQKLLTGDITNDSERNLIWAIVGQGILSNFLLGQGIGSYRILL